MSELDVTAGMADRSKDIRIQGQIIPPPGTTVGNVLTATATGSSWQAGGGGGGVTSVFGRNGAVVAVDGDYEGVVASALTGATAATRYVGGTASGSPSSGTFSLGDLVVDQSGSLWICTVAGSPGTWAQVSGGMVKLADNLMGADTASVTVSSISAAFTALKLSCYLRSTQAALTTVLSVQFNGDTGANYDSDAVSAIDNAAANGNLVTNTTGIQGQNMPGANAGASRFSAVEALIPNYTSTSGFKSLTGTSVTPIGAGGFTLQMFFGGGIWRSTNAVTSITLLPASGNFKAGSRVTVYGLI